MRNLVVLLLAFPQLAWAQVIPNEVIVRWKLGVTSDERAAVRVQANAQIIREFRFIEAEHLKLADDAISRLQNDPRVEYIEPNQMIRPAIMPNDPRFSEQWSLQNTGQTGGTAGADIDAVPAWSVYTGDSNLLIGVIDSGIDYNHPDLTGNVWTNLGEIPSNGLDDDNNGYVDDIHGYDIVNDDGDPWDDLYHGTHVSGIIAASGNNGVGISGVNWQAKLVGIKIFDKCGFGSVADGVAAFEYALAVGVRLTNNSWGYTGAPNQALIDAINACAEAGQICVAAAGNFNQDTDAFPFYPSSYDLPSIISVMATDHNDTKPTFSNYGLVTVDLGAPGVNILSTESSEVGGGYGIRSGTSMACPHVAGAVALAMGLFPSATSVQIKKFILDGVDALPSLSGKCVTGGRLNLLQSITAPVTSVPPEQFVTPVRDGYYDLAGRRLKAPPKAGLYWKVNGGKARKGVIYR